MQGYSTEPQHLGRWPAKPLGIWAIRRRDRFAELRSTSGSPQPQPPVSKDAGTAAQQRLQRRPEPRRAASTIPRRTDDRRRWLVPALPGQEPQGVQITPPRRSSFRSSLETRPRYPEQRRDHHERDVDQRDRDVLPDDGNRPVRDSTHAGFSRGRRTSDHVAGLDRDVRASRAHGDPGRPRRPRRAFDPAATMATEPHAWLPDRVDPSVGWQLCLVFVHADAVGRRRPSARCPRSARGPHACAREGAGFDRAGPHLVRDRDEAGEPVAAAHEDHGPALAPNRDRLRLAGVDAQFG